MGMESGMSLGDALALTKGNDGGFLGMGNSGGILALIIVFILLFGNGGFGFGGGREQYATNADLQRGFDTNTIVNKIDALGNGICDLGYANANLINGVNTTVMQSTNQIGSGISALGYQMQQCCCATQRENDSNTRDILEAICADGQATRALITENEMNRLRTDLQSAQLTLANANQSQTILNALGRYVTNPSCSWGYGCNCMSGVTIA